MNHRQVTTNGVRLHFVELGQGSPVVLLHGFPEFWYSWRHQLPALANAGFRAIAVDLRGYNDSDAPRGVRNYRMRELVADVVGLIEQECGGVAHLVGHDWGGVLAWRLAAVAPQHVTKLVVLNAAHPKAYLDGLRRLPSQWLRSWYVLLFQIPWLPEQILQARHFWSMARSFRRQPANRDAFDENDIAEYKKAWAKPGRLTAGLNYYRAALRYAGDLNSPPQEVACDTLLVWGERDPFASVKLLDRMSNWAPKLQIVRIPEASHWVQNEAPEKVNDELVRFLGS